MQSKNVILRKLLKSALAVSLLFSVVFAQGFTDTHSDGSLSGWTISGSRSWYESGGVASPYNASNYQGFLINDYACANDGTLEVRITANQWNGNTGGVVFRWTSSTSFYYVALLPANSTSNVVKFCKNTLSWDAGTVIASGLTMGTTYTLKVELSGSNFKFYIDGTYIGQIDDSDHQSGEVGYGYSNNYSDYIDYSEITWTEVASNSAPTDISLSPSDVDEGQPIGTVFGTFSTTDPDPSDVHTYTLVAGIGAEDNARFTITNDELKTAEEFTYDPAEPAYSIRVRSTDDGEGNLYFEKQFTITVNELEDYSQWTNAITVFFNTTPTGADVTGDVVNFPVVIRLNSANFDFSQAQDNGEDIRFESSDGTQLTYEIDEWSNSRQTATIWVTVPLLHGNSDQDYIIMYYGNSSVSDKSDPEEVFTTENGFAGVWHMSEDAAGSGTFDLYQDATANNSDGDDYASATGKSGIVGTGQEFDGYNDYINVPDFPDNDFNELTISVWVKLNPQSDSYWKDIISKEDNNYESSGFGLRHTYYDQFVFCIYRGGKQLLYGSQTGYVDDGNTWYHLTGSFDGSVQRIYMNGAEKLYQTLQPGLVKGTSQNLNIGRRVHDSNREVDGYLDEVRIETVSRSADWIKLCYTNQKENQAFISFTQGQPEVPAPTDFTATVIGGTNVLLSWQNNATNETGFEISYGPDVGSLQFLVDLGTNVESYTHTVGVCGQSYVYAIKAYNSSNESPLVILDQPAYTEPCVPTSLQAVPVSASEMGVSWDGNSPQYILEFSISGANDWTLLNSGTAKAYNHQGLLCNTAYDYRVKAVNPYGESNWTTIVIATTDQCLLEAPTDLIADNSIPDKILLNWTCISSAEDGFKIYRKEVSEVSYTEIGVVGVDITVYSDESVVCNTTYKYYVVAYNASTSSGASNIVEVTTLYCGSDKKTSELIRVTGMALNTDDTPVNGTKIVVVHLYNSKESSAVPIYDETISDVEIRNGFVSVPVGYGDTFKETITNNNTLYYDIIIDGESIFDDVLQNLTASPYTIKNTFNLHGAGSPIGTVSGPVGASYVDTDSQKLYMKYGETDNDWALIGQ